MLGLQKHDPEILLHALSCRMGETLAEKDDRARAKQRQQYARRKARRWRSKAGAACGANFTVSGGSGKHKRADARFCSNACRQKAHRKAVMAKSKGPPPPLNIRNADAQVQS